MDAIFCYIPLHWMSKMWYVLCCPTLQLSLYHDLVVEGKHLRGRCAIEFNHLGQTIQYEGDLQKYASAIHSNYFTLKVRWGNS